MRSRVDTDQLLRHVLIFITSLCMLFAAGLSAQSLQTAGFSPLPYGRLILTLHEGSPGPESPTSRSVGALTMRTAAALEQEAGIIVMSPALWHNIHHRRFAMAKSAEHIGSASHTITSAWRYLQTNASNRDFTTLHNAIKKTPSLLNTLFLWQLDLSEERWKTLLHEPTGMIIMIPHSYLAQRVPVLPRMMPAAHSPIEYATGLNLKTCHPIKLPNLDDDDGMRHLLRKAKRLRVKYDFEVDELSNLFLHTDQLPPIFHTHWHVYAMGHGQLSSNRDEWDHLKKNARQLDDKNTKTETHESCGVTIRQFRDILLMFDNKLATQFFYYQSCYSGGQHLAQLYRYNTYDRRIIGEQVTLSYPLVAGALSEAPVTVLMPRYRQDTFAGTINLVIDTDLPAFFNLLDDPDTELESILHAVTPPIPTTHDLHAISATPLLLLPSTNLFIPIDVTKSRSSNHTHSTRAGIAHLTHQEALLHDQESRPFVVRGKRAMLISPFRIMPEIELHAYAPPAHIAKTLPELPPALISIIPGNAIHHFNRITLHDVGLRSFLLHSFMQLMGRQTTKVYLIEHVRLNNDLAENFSDAPDRSILSRVSAFVRSWFTKESQTLSTPRITLEKVIVYVRNNRLDCYFIEPRTNNRSRARHIHYEIKHTSSGIDLYEQQQAHEKEQQKMHDDTIQLSIATVSDRTHRNLYYKYRSLFGKQSLDHEMSSISLAPITTLAWRRKH